MQSSSYDRIASAALARVNTLDAHEQRRRVENAVKGGHPIDADPDMTRRVMRVATVAGVKPEDAAKLVTGVASTESLAGENMLGAERILGETTDFVGVAFLDLARAASSCVGRVIFTDGRPQGSGFLISDRLFITNHHVIEDVAACAGFLVEFNYERDTHAKARVVTRFALDPQSFFLTQSADDLDYTIVALGKRVVGAGEVADFGFCPLFDSDDKHVLGEFVNIVQHPDGDYKQVVVRENRLVTRLEKVLHYQADTSPGSSGSPVFNDQWETVALHHWGGPHLQTTGRDGQPVTTNVNEGVRISAIVDELQQRLPTLAKPQQTLLSAALSFSFRNPSRADLVSSVATPPTALSGNVLPPAPQPPGPVVNTRKNENVSSSSTVEQQADGSLRCVVPVEIVVKLGGDKNGNGQTGNVLTVNGARSEKVAPDPNYHNRRGYVTDFLGEFDLPMPKVTNRALGTRAKVQLPASGDDPYELKYEHFSIVMNATRKMAFVTAANIDGRTSKRVDRKSGKVKDDASGEAARRAAAAESADFGAEASETWYADDRIADTAQTDQSLYSNQQPRMFDRGHQVRREDPVWGRVAEAERANADTFHFTNCCPQHKDFNERAKYWAGIENYVLDNARDEEARVCVFTGPVFARNDVRYRDVRVPAQFFKVIARVEDGELKATAFLASQAELLVDIPERIAGIVAEDFSDTSKVREYLTTVAEVEEITGLDFGELRHHDTHRPESITANVQPLTSLEMALGKRCRRPLRV